MKSRKNQPVFSSGESLRGNRKKLYGYVLHELVKSIYVGAPDESSGRREQQIYIEYNGFDFIPPMSR